MITPSILESFNARSTSIKQLCDSFITNQYFKTVASPNHAIVVGPRGSGKTTLLRMLQVESLGQWKHPEADGYRDSVDCFGVFIPTDRFWKTLYDKIAASPSLETSVRQSLDNVFTYHVLDRLLSTVRYRANRQEPGLNRFGTVELSKEAEAELVIELDKIWLVKPERNTLRSLISAIIRKKSELSTHVNNAIQRKHDVNKLISPSQASGNMLSIVSDSIKIVNLYLDQQGHKWMLLFDELELAPEPILNSLISNMRGGSCEDIILKLALSPYHQGLNLTKTFDDPMVKDDFEFINLNGLSKKEGSKFSRSLCGTVFEKKGLGEEINSYFECPKEKSREDNKQLFERLSLKDAGFNNYLQKNKIVPEEIPDYDEGKSPLVRKVKFIAELRDYYLREDGSKSSRNRAPDYYGGFEHVCRALEYNPRMLIGIMNSFVGYAADSNKISIAKQIRELNKFYESFRALLNTIAIESSDSKIDSVYDLVEEIGKYFSNQIVGEEFRADPKGYITFKKANDELFKAIGLALNAGAMIISESNHQAHHGFGDLKNAKCRLSYLFSHVFTLTLTLQNNGVEVVDIISSTLKVREPTKKSIRQLDLL